MATFFDRRNDSILDLGTDSEGIRTLASDKGMYQFHPERENPTAVKHRFDDGTEKTFNSQSERVKDKRVQSEAKQRGKGVIARKVVGPILAKLGDAAAKSTDKSARKLNASTAKRLEKDHPRR
ncbi:MAG: hypothetical protein EBR82_35010 [Caulobacteraceae bacterium]|nr:hypothetical protein [Caulobacteraceae bacterium]